MTAGGFGRRKASDKKIKTLSRKKAAIFQSP
jgi:hypothetical protein